MTVKSATRLRSEAAQYAKQFLAHKYREEFRELYEAYLINRNVPVKRKVMLMVDERELVNE
jgi:hypothetical protein